MARGLMGELEKRGEGLFWEKCGGFRGKKLVPKFILEVHLGSEELHLIWFGFISRIYLYIIYFSNFSAYPISVLN